MLIATVLVYQGGKQPNFHFELVDNTLDDTEGLRVSLCLSFSCLSVCLSLCLCLSLTHSLYRSSAATLTTTPSRWGTWCAAILC